MNQESVFEGTGLYRTGTCLGASQPGPARRQLCPERGNLIPSAPEHELLLSAHLLTRSVEPKVPPFLRLRSSTIFSGSIMVSVSMLTLAPRRLVGNAPIPGIPCCPLLRMHRLTTTCRRDPRSWRRDTCPRKCNRITRSTAPLTPSLELVYERYTGMWPGIPPMFMLGRAKMVFSLLNLPPGCSRSLQRCHGATAISPCKALKILMSSSSNGSAFQLEVGPVTIYPSLHI